MNTHLTEEQLNEYVDGVVSGDDVRDHVHSCAECAAQVAQLRNLIAAAETLPESIEPPPELWSELRAVTIDARANRAAVLHSLRVPLAAAALVLVGAASLLTWYVTRASAPAPTTVAVREVPASQASLVGLKKAEADHIAATRTLMQIFEQRKSQMDPKVVATVEQNLRIMNTAIENAQKALASDPANQDVASILQSTYQSKVKMLRRAVSAGET